MATDLSLIVDSDNLRAFTVSVSKAWTFRGEDSMYKKSSWNASRGPGPFIFSFEGTSVAFVGILPTSSSQGPTAQIDNGTVFSINYDDSSLSTYKQWFQSPKLYEGSHTITVTCLEGTIIDFAIVAVGNQTRLAGTNIVVDNDRPSILYSGHWSRNTSEFNSNILGKGYPYGNTTHCSSTPGDTFVFRFTGTSVSVYGIVSWSNPGILSATFRVDKTTFDKTYNVTNSSRSSAEEPNFLFYSVDNLSAGNHTLIVTITAAKNQTFMLDYVTYTPSFETLLSMPLLSNPTPTTTSLRISGSLRPSPVPSGTSQPSPAAGIVGGAIGGFALVTMLGVWLFLRRRKAKQTESISQYSYAPTNGYSYQNDANNRPNSNGKQKHMRQLQPQPVKFGGSNLAVQPTNSDPQPRPSQASHIGLTAEETVDPPPYDALSCARSVTHNTAL